MKLVKLSLVAALAAGAFSVANATPLEEAIKDIDVSGMLRYRYESGRWDKPRFDKGGNPFGGSYDDLKLGNTSNQNHKYKAQLNLSGDIADSFKAFVQFQYTSTDGGFGKEGGQNTYQSNNISDTKNTFIVRQAYLTYTDDNSATSIMLGKQQLNTIWTDDLVGTGAKVMNNSVDGLTLAAFAVDAFDAKTIQTSAQKKPDNNLPNVPSLITNQFNGNDSDASSVLNWGKNLYGAAVLGSYEVLGGQFNPQLWLAYMDKNAFLYALDVSYSATVFDGVNWTLEGAYLGNSLNSELKDFYKEYVTTVNNKDIFKDTAGNGNFFALRGSIEVAGWDASLGGLYYGKKDKTTVITIEDTGSLGSLLAGQEILYTNGSYLNGSQGKNTFGYVTLGYTFDETVRIGGDLVYGGTTQGNAGNDGAKKLEAVARVDYKYSPKLSFSAFYSYLDINKQEVQGQPSDDTSKDTVRLQALYKF